MKPTVLNVSIVILVAIVGWFGVQRLSSSQPIVASAAVTPDADLIALKSYLKWRLVNPTPELMEPAAAISCFRIMGREEGSPHLHKYVSVYVNSTGRDAMLKQRRPKFPVGSMIVKEKLGSLNSKSPEILTAMIKREPGYDPSNGDWEYFLLDGSASKIEERGKISRCSGCHQSYESTDFVTRTYLPHKVSLQLK
jgi:hypothetical protein